MTSTNHFYVIEPFAIDRATLIGQAEGLTWSADIMESISQYLAYQSRPHHLLLRDLAGYDYFELVPMLEQSRLLELIMVYAQDMVPARTIEIERARIETCILYGEDLKSVLPRSIQRLEAKREKTLSEGL